MSFNLIVLFNFNLDLISSSKNSIHFQIKTLARGRLKRLLTSAEYFSSLIHNGERTFSKAKWIFNVMHDDLSNLMPAAVLFRIQYLEPHISFLMFTTNCRNVNIFYNFHFETCHKQSLILSLETWVYALYKQKYTQRGPWDTEGCT